ncbi:hypothetical protein M422DRAFT_37035 [Sphaerobolus stellatus SS14]|uniref:Hydantoinase n=1 Tax=Sphaerobolus stellatus (strain SS14) TaxID=990650 RepID=A0A0C9UV90_SPHS4|nr:hypothetical protein M422DRAFT_37035 [Sphaerobolus stellatus SS14]
MATSVYRIGVDVGGTNTDSVLFCSDVSAASRPDRGIVASFKHPTTHIVSDGIEAAIRKLLEKTQVDPAKVTSVMIGNAVVEADTRRLSNVAVIRLGAPYTEECPPFLDFPRNLRSIMEGHVAFLKGGLEIDGKLINEIDEQELIAEGKKIQSKGIKAVAIVGIYSPLDLNDGQSQEERARDILVKVLDPSVDIVCSRNVGQVGLLERENASILNASIMAFARRTISGFQRAIRRLGLSCPLFLTQNDGTLTSAQSAAKLPIRTFSSGATNSMRGAAYLAGLGDKDSSIVKDSNSSIIVVDGFFLARRRFFSGLGFSDGVRFCFSMPDVYSIGLGGGSRIHVNDSGRHITVGPDSTGYQLLTEGLAFGGSTLTATDIIVAENVSLSIGDHNKVTGDVINRNTLQGAKAAIKKLLEDVIDRMKTSPEPAIVLLVGGGSIIAPDKLEGVRELIRPPFFSCANAVGACVANVAGELDTIEILQDRQLADVLEVCKAEAISRAIKAGAKEDTVRVVEVDNLPIQYVTNKATRIIVKAIGELDPIKAAGAEVVTGDSTVKMEEDMLEEEITRGPALHEALPIDAWMYVPNVNAQGEWFLSETDLEWIAEGCGILGTGGGGSPYPPFIMARQILRDGGVIRVIAHDALPDDAVSLPAAYGIPASLTPCAIADGVGNAIILPSTSNQYMVETILRSVCTDLGSKAGVSMAPLSAKICREYGVTRSVSQAWRIGRAVAQERQRNNMNGIPEAILNLQNGKVIFIGKIVDVQREVRAGFTWGSVMMTPLSTDEQEESSGFSWHSEDRMLITFQNENLTAEMLHRGSTSSKELMAVVPDLITVLDSQSGSSLGTNEYRYGLRVTVMALAGSPLWTTPEGLRNGGPAAFGLSLSFIPVGSYLEPRSVIEEYRPKLQTSG